MNLVSDILQCTHFTSGAGHPDGGELAGDLDVGGAAELQLPALRVGAAGEAGAAARPGGHRPRLAVPALRGQAADGREGGPRPRLLRLPRAPGAHHSRW